MDLKTHNIDHESFMQNNLDLNPQQDTGFVENWGTAIGLAIDEELSISSMINSPEFTPRNEELYRLIKEGSIANSEAFIKGNSASYVEYDWNALAREAKKQGFDVKTDSEMLGDTRNELAHRRRYAQGIMSQANGWGIAGQFAGYLNAGAVDPVNAGAALLGPVAIAKYIGNISSVRRLMVAEGALGVTSEAAIAPFVHEWKETLGVDYTLEEALINMGAAGLLGAGIGGLAGKLGQIIRQAEEDGIDVTPLKFQKEELERAAEVEEWSDMSPEDFFRRMDEMEKEINGWRPADPEIEEIEIGVPEIGPGEEAEFRVAAKDAEGVIVEGEVGQIHAQLEGENLGEMGFVDQYGKFYSRKEALTKLKESEPEFEHVIEGLDAGDIIAAEEIKKAKAQEFDISDDLVPVKEPVDEVKDFLREIGEEMEIYVSTEEGITKIKASEANTALDNRIKDAENEMGVPICGE